MIRLPKRVQEYVNVYADLCKPENIHICDGSEEEYNMLIAELEKSGSIQRLTEMKNW
jgi:phosphoenolpyruvate carboxykinase (GTP)